MLDKYACTVIVTAYEAEQTIEQCLLSIFHQETSDINVLLLVGYDHSKDQTFEKLIDIQKKCPKWIEMRILVNNQQSIFINNRKTGRSNFIGCMQKTKGDAILFCDGDDYWIDKKKLQKQLKIIRQSGRSSYTPVENRARTGRFYNPFRHGNKIILSSLCIPTRIPLDDDISRKIPLLDWYLVCACFSWTGLVCVRNSATYYTSTDGAWSSLSKSRRISETDDSAKMLLKVHFFGFIEKFFLRLYLLKLKYSRSRLR